MIFEAVTMALTIIVCNAFINAGLPTFTSNYADWAKTLIYLCEMIFTIALTAGSVKGEQSLTTGFSARNLWNMKKMLLQNIILRSMQSNIKHLVYLELAVTIWNQR